MFGNDNSNDTNYTVQPTEPVTGDSNNNSDGAGASFLDDNTPTNYQDEATSPPQQPTTDTPLTAPENVDDLLRIKQMALQQLSPLVSHLDQPPEEKFRTTMMMIQASDNQTLIQSAYDIAQTITEDKTRAQALLDIVNEINYFTQQKN